MALQRLILALCLAASCASPAVAATRLVAPETVRALLERYLPLAAASDSPVTPDAPDAALDGGARAALERRLRKEAGELLATEGYFSPQIDLLERDGALVLQVEPGPLAKIASVDIEIRGAVADARRRELIDGWSLPVASGFRQSAWDDAKQGLLRELMAVDHAGARLVSSQAEVDVGGAGVALRLVYDGGPRYRYGELNIVGLRRYPPALVERYSAMIRPGQDYRQEDLLSVQTALQNTPYFSSVSVELAPAASAADETPSTGEETLPVTITLREREPFRIALGAGYSTNTGARVEGNFRSADFLGRAWELSSGVRIEQLRQVAYADVFLPPDRERRRDSVGTVVERSDIEGLALERLAVAVARAEQIGSVERRLGLGWQYERQTPDGVAQSVSRALTATTGWVWRHAADPLDLSEGIVAQLQLGVAAKALLSDQDFLRTYFRYSQGIPLGRSDSLLLRGELGVTVASSRQGIPQDFLFRAGGSNSVRGYDYQSLGVKEGSATLGGRYLATVSAEYTHWIDAQWGVATFVDAGQAADDRAVWSLAPGFGVGARWKSPAGPLAVDLAWGQRDQQLRLHFSLAVPF
jgi:translocation and assembly module TamA